MDEFGSGKCLECNTFGHERSSVEWAVYFGMPIALSAVAGALNTWQGAGSLVEKAMMSEVTNHLQLLDIVFEFERNPSNKNSAMGSGFLEVTSSTVTFLVLPQP